jgi:AcrR family transcriptional regulator
MLNAAASDGPGFQPASVIARLPGRILSTWSEPSTAQPFGMEARLSGRTREDHTARRARIVDQAIHVIGERGYYGFTVQEVAKACGLSNAGLLHHFPSREHLFLAALHELEAGEAEAMAPLVAAAERARGGDRARQAVLDVLRTLVQRAIARPQLVRFFAEVQVEALNPSHPAHEWWRRRESETMGLFARLLAPHCDDAEAVARQLLALIDGISLRWLWAGQAFDAVAEWDRMIARFAPELHPSAPAAR